MKPPIQRIQRRRHNKTLVSKGLLITYFIIGCIGTGVLIDTIVRYRELKKSAADYNRIDSRLTQVTSQLQSMESYLVVIRSLLKGDNLTWYNYTNFNWPNYPTNIHQYVTNGLRYPYSNIETTKSIKAGKPIWR